MMPLDRAVREAFKRCERLVYEIEKQELATGKLDWKRRCEMGAWRQLLLTAGLEKDKLPETPFLDPKVLEAHKRWLEHFRKEKKEHGHSK
jgi:hypothetical protein